MDEKNVLSNTLYTVDVNARIGTLTRAYPLGVWDRLLTVDNNNYVRHYVVMRTPRYDG